MGIRETMNNAPVAVASGAGVLILCTAVFVWRQIAPSSVSASSAPTSLYFTTDDGKSFFPGDASHTAPFEINGKTAVQAVVFSSDHNATRFVGYLKRSNPAAVHSTAPPGTPAAAYADAISATTSTQVKRPGDANWVLLRSPAGVKVTQVHGPTGTPDPVEVTP